MGRALVSESIVQETLEATMRDGTVLRSDVWRPSGGGRHPVLLIRLPYDKSQGEDLCYAHPSWYARHGYAVVSQDVRGRWASGGEFVPFESEADDGEDTMEWLGSLPFSNGRIGMYGVSYPGHTQLQIAGRKPEGLRCMVPPMTSPDPYEGWGYNKGAFPLAFKASRAAFLPDDVVRRHEPGHRPLVPHAVDAGFRRCRFRARGQKPGRHVPAGLLRPVAAGCRSGERAASAGFRVRGQPLAGLRGLATRFQAVGASSSRALARQLDQRRWLPLRRGARILRGSRLLLL